MTDISFKLSSRVKSGLFFLLLVLLLLSYRIFYLGFKTGESISPTGDFRLVFFYVPSLLDLRIHPPGDALDRYIWVRLYSREGDKLEEKLLTLSQLNDKPWAGDAVVPDSDIVWKLPINGASKLETPPKMH